MQKCHRCHDGVIIRIVGAKLRNIVMRQDTIQMLCLTRQSLAATHHTPAIKGADIDNLIGQMSTHIAFDQRI